MRVSRERERETRERGRNSRERERETRERGREKLERERERVAHNERSNRKYIPRNSWHILVGSDMLTTIKTWRMTIPTDKRFLWKQGLGIVWKRDIFRNQYLLGI